MNEEDAKAFGKTYGICVRVPPNSPTSGASSPGTGRSAPSTRVGTTQPWTKRWRDSGLHRVHPTALIERKKPSKSPRKRFSQRSVSADADTPDSPWSWKNRLLSSIPEQPDDFDEVAEEGKDPFDAFLPLTGPNPDDLKDAAKALEDFAAVLKEHAVLTEPLTEPERSH